MTAHLEDVASRFEITAEGGLYAVLGPPGCGKSSLFSPDLLITKEAGDSIESIIDDYIATARGGGQIVFDEINPRFYKSSYFKRLCNSAKQNGHILILISRGMRDLPPLTRNKIDYWFLFKLDNNYLGFSPLNNLSDWQEPPRKKYTAIVAQFLSAGKPSIWWYSKEPEPVVQPEPIPIPTVETSYSLITELDPKPDLLPEIKKSLERIELRLDKIDKRLSKLEKKVDGIAYVD